PFYRRLAGESRGEKWFERFFLTPVSSHDASALARPASARRSAWRHTRVSGTRSFERRRAILRTGRQAQQAFQLAGAARRAAHRLITVDQRFERVLALPALVLIDRHAILRRQRRRLR